MNIIRGLYERAPGKPIWLQWKFPMGEMRQGFMAGGPSKVPIYGRQSWQIKTQDALLNLNFMLTMIFFSMSMSQTLQERPLFYLAT